MGATYGSSPARIAEMLKDKQGRNANIDECAQIIEDYFVSFPKVKQLMLDSHRQAIDTGEVHNLFGRPRHITEAKKLKAYGPNIEHSKLTYLERNPLNLAINARIQNTAGSLMNRAMIAFYRRCKALGLDTRIVMTVHDEIIIECLIADAEQVKEILRDTMQNTTKIPGVDLLAEPVIGARIGDLK